MSDARPITDVTDYVCGSCWSSFSTSSPGVAVPEQTAGRGMIKCPHCGHIQTAGRSVIDAVNAAPTTTIDPGSGTFETVSVDTASAKLAAPVRHLSAPGAIETQQHVAVVAAPQDEDDAEAMAALVSTVGAEADPGPQAAPVVQVGAIAGQITMAEAGFDADDPMLQDATDPEVDVAAIVAELDAGDAAEPSVDDDTGEFEAGQVAEALAVSHRASEPEPDPEPEPHEWKLKAPPGLTYNFHSLDALVGWVGAKDPDDMQISIDAVTWRPFGPFLLAAREGLSGRQSWDVAGGAPIHARHASIRSAMDDIADVDALVSAQADLRLAPALSFGAEAVPTTDSDDAISTATEHVDPAPAEDQPEVLAANLHTATSDLDKLNEPEPASSAAVAARPRVATGRQVAVGGTRRATGARPVPQKVALQKTGGGPPVLAIVAAVVIVGAVVAALFLTHVI